MGFLLLTLEPGNRVCVFHQCVSHGRWWATQTARRSCGNCTFQASSTTSGGKPDHQKLPTGARMATPASLADRFHDASAISYGNSEEHRPLELGTHLCGMCLRQLHMISPPMEKPVRKNLGPSSRASASCSMSKAMLFSVLAGCGSLSPYPGRSNESR